MASISRSIMGGETSSIPIGTPRKFPGAERRKIFWSASTWKSVVPDASHWHVKFEFESNPYICACPAADGQLHEHTTWDMKDKGYEIEYQVCENFWDMLHYVRSRVKFFREHRPEYNVMSRREHLRG